MHPVFVPVSAGKNLLMSPFVVVMNSASKWYNGHLSTSCHVRNLEKNPNRLTMKHDYALGDCGCAVKLRKSCYPTLSTSTLTNLPLSLCSMSSGMNSHISQALSQKPLLK